MATGFRIDNELLTSTKLTLHRSIPMEDNTEITLAEIAFITFRIIFSQCVFALIDITRPRIQHVFQIEK